MEVLFKTQHGSKLYGLEHAGSDDDWFTVVTKKDTKSSAHTRKRYATHKIVDGVDSVVVDFGTWLVGCDKGVPQFLEAMYSQTPEIDQIAEFRKSFVVTQGVYETYFRTIKSFALQEGFKHKRHALRLALNLQSIGRYGRFNPRLSDEDKAYVTWMATKGNDDVYGLALCLAYDV